MRKILLDTNFLLIPIQFKVDIFQEIQRVCDFRYTLYIVDQTLEELRQIGLQGKVKDRLAAKVAISLVKSKNIQILDSHMEKVDDAITRLAGESIIVATNDRGLKRRVLEKGARVLALRQEKYLILS